MATPRTKKQAASVEKTPGLRAKRPKGDVLTQRTSRAALDRATRAIKHLNRDGARNAWRIGQQFAQVSELALHTARGHATMRDYAEKELSIDGDYAYRCMRIAQAFSEDFATDHGTEKLDRMLRYLAATPEDDGPGDVTGMKVRVPQEDGSVREVAFERVTVAELRSATAAERAAATATPKRRQATMTRERQAELSAELNAALDASVGRKMRAHADAAVRVRDGVPVLAVTSPLSKATPALRAALATVKKYSKG